MRRAMAQPCFGSWASVRRMRRSRVPCIKSDGRLIASPYPGNRQPCPGYRQLPRRRGKVAGAAGKEREVRAERVLEVLGEKPLRCSGMPEVLVERGGACGRRAGGDGKT